MVFFDGDENMGNPDNLLALFPAWLTRKVGRKTKRHRLASDGSVNGHHGSSLLGLTRQLDSTPRNNSSAVPGEWMARGQNLTAEG